MRGKKAKMLRKLAACNSKNPQTRYAELKGSKKLVGIPKLDKGSVVLNILTGKPELIGTYETVTLIVHNCSRKLYKMLKSQYYQTFAGNWKPIGNK
jgi:hypothetical protein